LTYLLSKRQNQNATTKILSSIFGKVELETLWKRIKETHLLSNYPRHQKYGPRMKWARGQKNYIMSKSTVITTLLFNITNRLNGLLYTSPSSKPLMEAFSMGY
jgi:hypothetical protein